MAEGLAKKKKVCGTQKSVITRLLNKIGEITKAEANLKKKLDTLKKLEDEIFKLSEDKDRH